MSNVDHPKHYNVGKIEVISAIEDWGLGFSLGNTVKYIARSGYKGNRIEDLEKAMWYLNRESERAWKDFLSMKPQEYKSAEISIDPGDAAWEWNLDMYLTNCVIHIAESQKNGQKLKELTEAARFLQAEIDRLKKTGKKINYEDPEEDDLK